MHFIKLSVTTMVILFLGSQLALAQVQQPQQPQQPEIPAPDEISDEELVRFVDVSDIIQPIQQDAQTEIMGVIEDEGMDVERFQQIMMSMRQPQDTTSQVEITADEREAVQAIQPQLTEVQMEAEEQIVEEIEGNGFELDRFQGIYASLQQHPELLERLQALIETDE